MLQDDVAVQRWLIFGLVFSTTAAATARLLEILRIDGLSVSEILLLTIFALLFSWITMSFWIACFGVYSLWRGTPSLQLGEPASTDLGAISGHSRTVLVMPIHNENCTQVFARLRAIKESLNQARAGGEFDFFVLSDSSDQQHGAAEERACRHLRQQDDEESHTFYRRREHNIGYKSGNIEDFCKNWGALYDYMIVLDADSLMTGDAIVRLVRLMDDNPRTALVQAAPLLIGGQSLFARSQQFASWSYGQVYAAGFARLQGADGNYWGHNAIIRVKPFMENCGLPALPGRPPLGGTILSHDFVEAALLRRAGWDIWLVTDIGGSYEAPPPTIIDHLKRDRRWCQGNLQHIKLIFAQGLRLPSRLHLALGAISYLSSPLWLTLVVLFALNSAQLQHVAPVTYVGQYPVLRWPISHTVGFVTIAIATLAMLYAPKFLSLVLLLHDRHAVRSFGGAPRLILSVIVEILISTLMAPVFMLSHSWFVLTILLGRTARWGVQPRGSKGTGLGQAIVA
ncbi:MAG: glucans biosynthesis glucosyltransferase MdoH, partial [Pseudolabrys sp.]